MIGTVGRVRSMRPSTGTALRGGVKAGPSRPSAMPRGAGASREGGRSPRSSACPGGAGEEPLSWLLACRSPAESHIALTCLQRQVPALTPLESIPGFISSHSASIREHLSRAAGGGFTFADRGPKRPAGGRRGCRAGTSRAAGGPGQPVPGRACRFPDGTAATEGLNAAWEGSLLPSSPPKL